MCSPSSKARYSRSCGPCTGLRKNEVSLRPTLRSNRSQARSFENQAVYGRFDGQGLGRESPVAFESFTSYDLTKARSCSSPCMQRASWEPSQPPNSRRSAVPSKTKRLTKAEIAAFEEKRDIGQEVLQSIRDLKAGKGQVVVSPAIEARTKTGLSQSQFAELLGVSVRTLQGWEQGRKQPSGAARTLLAIARTNPKAVLSVSLKAQSARE